MRFSLSRILEFLPAFQSQPFGFRLRYVDIGADAVSLTPIVLVGYSECVSHDAGKQKFFRPLQEGGMGFREVTGLAKWSDVLRCVFASMLEVSTMIDLDEA